MIRIVLDVNMLLIDNPPPKFRSVKDWELVATERLFEELYTHRKKGKPYRPYRKEDASKNAFAALSRIAAVVPIIIQSSDPCKFEIETGSPASPAKIWQRFIVPSEMPIPSDKELQDMQAQKDKMGVLMQFQHPKEFEQEYRSLRSLQADDKLFPRLAELLSEPKTTDAIQERALKVGEEYAARHGLTVAKTFKPNRGWLSFGYELAGMAYILWKYARYGDNVPTKATNHSYDLTYVAHIAICDGVVSNDKTVLQMAWTCWPEKRQNIWTYDGRQGEIVRYTPPWESQ